MLYETKTETFFVEERPILLARTSIPLLESCQRAEEFYRELTEECRKFCGDVLAPRLAEHADTAAVSPIYRYGMSAVAVYEDEDYLCVRVSVTLRNERSAKRLYAFGDAQVLSRSDGRMLPPKQIWRRWGEKGTGKRMPRLHGGILMENGYLKVWRDGSWQVLCPMRTDTEKAEKEGHERGKTRKK